MFAAATKDLSLVLLSPFLPILFRSNLSILFFKICVNDYLFESLRDIKLELVAEARLTIIFYHVRMKRRYYLLD